MIEKNIHSLLINIANVLLFVFTFSFIAPLYAKDLGVVGQTYPILEDDLLEFIQQRIHAMQKNGNWQSVQNEMKKRVAEHTDRPLPITNIHKTINPKTWHYNPSIVAPYDLRDSMGKVFVKAGTRINPLTYVSLHTALAFYDADDESQVEWAKSVNKKYEGKIKLVLVKGSISQQQKIFHQPIYFDQQGKLTSNFHITQVPSLVYQDGMQLTIAEVVP